MSEDHLIHILFIRTDRLGDVLVNLPAIAALRQAFPAARLTVMAHPDVASLLALVPEIDEVLVEAPDARAWWWRGVSWGCALRPRRFNTVIVSNPKAEYHLAVWLAGVPQRIGYNRKWGRLLTHRLPDRKHLGLRHEVESNMELLRPLGVDRPAPSWRFPVLHEQQADVRQILQQAGVAASKPFIVVHPWTSNPAKRWPLERFRQLIERLLQQGQLVVLIGGQAEAAHVFGVLPATPGVVNLVGRLTLPQLAGLLQCAERLISNDSGPAHLAAAVGLPTIVLFGAAVEATGPRRWGPWGSGHVVIERSVITDITVEDVLEAIAQPSRMADAASTPSRR